MHSRYSRSECGMEGRKTADSHRRPNRRQLRTTANHVIRQLYYTLMEERPNIDRLYVQNLVESINQKMLKNDQRLRAFYLELRPRYLLTYQSVVKLCSDTYVLKQYVEYNTPIQLYLRYKHIQSYVEIFLPHSYNFLTSHIFIRTYIQTIDIFSQQTLLIQMIYLINLQMKITFKSSQLLNDNKQIELNKDLSSLFKRKYSLPSVE